MGIGNVTIAQFTSSSTAAAAVLELGFIPDAVLFIADDQGTNPNWRLWINPDKFSMAAAGADDDMLITGTTGVITLDTASVATYAGGDVVSATDVTNRKYFNRQGTVQAAGHVAAAGISIPAGDQVNSGKNTIIAFRDDVA